MMGPPPGKETTNDKVSAIVILEAFSLWILLFSEKVYVRL